MMAMQAISSTDTDMASAHFNLICLQGLKVPSTSISREDVAQLLVRALQKRPTGTLRIAAESKPLGAQFKNWDQLFANLDT